jgi:hypothetical protein
MLATPRPTKQGFDDLVTSVSSATKPPNTLHSGVM